MVLSLVEHQLRQLRRFRLLPEEWVLAHVQGGVGRDLLVNRGDLRMRGAQTAAWRLRRQRDSLGRVCSAVLEALGPRQAHQRCRLIAAAM
jgi:hypothetical protein